jgi:tetratricopeptide (TPR) repeat protein
LITLALLATAGLRFVADDGDKVPPLSPMQNGRLEDAARVAEKAKAHGKAGQILEVIKTTRHWLIIDREVFGEGVNPVIEIVGEIGRPPKRGTNFVGAAPMNARNRSSLRVVTEGGIPTSQLRQDKARGIVRFKRTNVHALLNTSRGNIGPTVAMALLVLALNAPPRANGQAPTTPSPAALATSARQERLKERDRLAKQAQAFAGQGNMAEAIAAGRKKLDIEREVLGNRHDEVIITLHLLAKWQMANEAFEDARKDLQDVLDIQIKRYNEQDWRAADARRTLADHDQLAKMRPAPRKKLAEAERLDARVAVLYAQGNSPEAEKLSRAALDLRKEVLGEQHPDLAASLNRLGLVLEKRRDLNSAVDCYKRSLAMRERLYPPADYPRGHPDLAASLSNLGLALDDRGDLDAAVDHHARALAMRERLYPPADYPRGHPDLANSLNNLGRVHTKRGDYAAAVDIFTRALAMQERLHPPADYPRGHPDLANSLNSLGGVLYYRGDYDAAVGYYTRALAMRERLYPPSEYPRGHPEVAASLNNLGLVFQDHGDYDAAVDYYTQALARWERLYPSSEYPRGHPKLAIGLNNLGLVFEWRGDLDAAVDHHARA